MAATHPLWPWLVLAAAGALHGLNPATGWGLAAACGWRSGDRAQVRRALTPLALGHLASVGLIAGAVALAPALERTSTWALQACALLWLLGRAVRHLHRREQRPRGRLGLALWSFVMATAHGAGLMLVPALVPLCLSAAPAREITASGSLALALLAVAVHLAAMLAVTLAMAHGAQWLGRRLHRG